MVGEKTNEIPEIPKLLDDLNIEGAVISIDAMGCQKDIATKIIDKKANYFLALKGNQSTLESEALHLFKQKENVKSFSFYEEYDKGHGRVEIRKCWSVVAPDWFKNQGWQELKSISMIESERVIKGESSIEQRIYISSLEADAKQHFNYARQHWLVENSVHWVLDVTFKEDYSQIKNAAENMSVIRKIIINLIKIYKEKIQSKSSLRTLRMMAGWSEDVAGGILGGLFV
jgi:predicted transposase YbfD/YdcC